MKNLSRRTESIMRALIDILQPKSDKLDFDLSDDMVVFSDEFLGHLPLPVRKAFPLGLYFLEFATPLFGGGFTRFSKLGKVERERYIRGWAESRLAMRRDLIKGVKTIALCGYFSDKEVMRRLGYDPDEWVAEARELRQKLIEKYEGGGRGND